MITRYNTNRDATLQVISSSALVVLTLLIAPPALIYTAPNPTAASNLPVVYAFFWGCGVLLIIFCVYRYFHWSEHDDAYLLSGKTLAILSPGKPVRFVKPHEIVAVKPEGTTILLANGNPLKLPRILPEPGVPSLPEAVVIAWFGKEHLDAARSAYSSSMRPSPRAIVTAIVIVAILLLVSLGLSTAGMWREFARFSYGAFIAGSGVVAAYFLALAYNARTIVHPLLPFASPLPDTSVAEAAARSPRSGSRMEILRFPVEQPRAIEHAAMSLLVLLGLCIFIPMCQMALSSDTIEQGTRVLVYLVAFDLALVALFCIWRLYQTVIRGDIFVTLLLSRRTIVIVRPRKSTLFVKPAECAALVCGRNELVLNDGRTVKLPSDAQMDENRTTCRTLCDRWWPGAYGEEPAGIWARISRPCRKKIAIGLGIVGLGVALLVVDPSPWGTAIAHHFILPGGILALYGYWSGLRGHGRVIDLPVPAVYSSGGFGGGEGGGGVCGVFERSPKVTHPPIRKTL